MGKILVLYDSKTGNTRKMAELVAEGAACIQDSEVRLKSVDEASREDICWCDGIAVGAPANMGLLSWKMKRFWDELQDCWGSIDGKIGCAFSTSGGWGGGGELTCQSILTVLMNFGFLVFGLPDYVAKQFTLHYGAVIAGEPRQEKEIESCRRLGKRLAEWVGVYMDGKKELRPGPVDNRC
jgi:NAD(P)H dehydrogenase (quinone)